MGPFDRGMYLGVGSITNDASECSDIVNWDIQFDKTLKTRNRMDIVNAVAQPGQPAGRVSPVGFYRDFTNGLRIFFAAIDGTYVWNGTAYTKISSDIASAVWQYNNTAWVVMETGLSGSWTPAGGFVTIAAMPKGTCSLIAKDILYIGDNAGQSRISYSKPTDFTVWAGSGAGFFDVNPNDGTLVQSMENYNDQILIFKDRSIYALSTPGLPATATLRLVSDVVGTINSHTTDKTENAVVTLFDGVLYAVSNNNVTSLSDQLTSDMDTTTFFGLIPDPPVHAANPPSQRAVGQHVIRDDDPWVSYVQGDKVIVRTLTGRYFVLHTIGDQPAWTRYAFLDQPAVMEEFPSFLNITDTQVLCGLASATFGLYHFDLATGTELTTCGIRTRPVYAGGESMPTHSNFQRLFRWGMSGVGIGRATGTVRPVLYAAPVTWASLTAAPTKWNQMVIWENPLSELPKTITTVDIATLLYDWVWFDGNMRGRGFIFEVAFQLLDSTHTGRLFTMEAWTTLKARTFARVS